MSDSANTSKAPAVSKAACCLWLPIVALVFLRLCVGWHFFSEGIKKFEYDQSRGEWKLVFSAEGFLGGAKGPLAAWYHDQAPTTHNWRKLLVVPSQLNPERSAKLTAWVSSYVKRRQGEINSGKPTPAQFAAFSPAAAWGERIYYDWLYAVDRFAKTPGLSDDQRKQAEPIFKKYELYLADFLAEEALDIDAYQHELWRLEQAEKDPAATEVPFEIERIADQQAAVNRTPGKWIAQVKAMDAGFADALRAIANADDATLIKQIDAAVTDPGLQRLHRNNMLVTCVVIGVGVCLLLGLFTRTAAVVGALFLLSVMLSQPPWVLGAMSPVPYYYQLVEFAALLFLAAVGAGKWAGLDFIIQGLWRARRGTQGA